MGHPRSWCWTVGPPVDPWCFATSTEHRRYVSSLSTWRLVGMWLNNVKHIPGTQVTQMFKQSEKNVKITIKSHSKTIQSHETHSKSS
jgi:hypothetical protein